MDICFGGIGTDRALVGELIKRALCSFDLTGARFLKWERLLIRRFLWLNANSVAITTTRCFENDRL